MTLEELKSRPRKATEHEWAGEKIWLRKLSAQDHLDLFGKVASAEEPATAEANRAATVDFHINVIVRALSDKDGNLEVRTDDDRRWLREEVDYDDLIALSELVLAHSGYRTEKKTS